MYECVSMHDDVLFFDVVATATATSTRSEFITNKKNKLDTFLLRLVFI